MGRSRRGTEFVINRYRSAEQNLRTTFERIIKRAGLAPWKRLFQNLRASAITELMATYPAMDVSAWLGNSVPVAMRHYAMATDDNFQAAAGMSPAGGNTGGNIMGISQVISSDSAPIEKAAFPGKNGLLRGADGSCEPVLVGDEGLEDRSNSSKKQASSLGEVTPQVTSGEIQSQLELINAKWSSLPSTTRQAIFHLIESAVNE